MKYVLLFTFLVGSLAEAAEHTFKYKMGNDTLEIKIANMDYDEAFEKAAKQCYKYFKNGEKLTEERGLDIIDVCANPRK